MKKRSVAIIIALLLVLVCTGFVYASDGKGSTVVDRATMETKDWNDPSLKLRLRWSGVNFYEFVLPSGKTIVMDPYFDQEPAGGHNEFNYTPTKLPAGDWVNGADYVILTHGHFDHVDQLGSILMQYPKAHVIAPEHVWPAIMWQLKLEYSTHYFHEVAALDKLEFKDFTLESCRSNHNVASPPKADSMKVKSYSDANGNLNFYELYRKIYEREIMNGRITTDDGFSILIWNSEMQADGYGFEDRAWFYRDSKPDLFMYQVAGASFDYDRRNPNYKHMAEWIASVDATAALPEHQQHYSYQELDTMAGVFSATCNTEKANTEFLTPETGVWYGYTKDANGNVKVYKVVNAPAK